MQMRGEVKNWWGDLTADDLDRIAGERDKLIGPAKSVGYARERRRGSDWARDYERTAR